MKKFLSALLVIFILLGATASAGVFEGNFLDPMNNELFEVVAELDYYDDYNMEFFSRDKVFNEDYTLAKIVETVISYDGTVTQRDLCDFMDSGECEKYYFAEGAPERDNSIYNDGLKYFSNMEEYSFGYTDINDEVKYVTYAFDYFGFDYNLGILGEGENNGYAGLDLPDREYKTTFTNIMTDNQKYEFNCDIGMFNDDGYALMRYNKKMYVVKLRRGVIPTVFYNGKKIKFDQIPVIEGGRTLVPLRAIFETFGAEVDWDGITKTVTAVKDNTEVKLTIDSTTAYKNGQAITLDVPAKIVNGRTLVPVRFVSDCFAVSVDWDDTMRRVILTQ